MKALKPLLVANFLITYISASSKSYTGRFYDFEYPISPNILIGKTTVNLRIEANYDRTAWRIFGCRTIKE